LKTWNALSSTLALALLFSISQTALARAEEDEDLLGKLQFHGYGELHYNNPKIDTMSSGAGNVIDVHRFVLGWEYEFTENLRVEAELDYEHAAKELELEEAYLEYDLLPAVSLRVGTVLMPVGPLNETHEPPLYYSVERPYVERYIIPTTWQENGLGVAGRPSEGFTTSAPRARNRRRTTWPESDAWSFCRHAGSRSRAPDITAAPTSGRRGWGRRPL